MTSPNSQLVLPRIAMYCDYFPPDDVSGAGIQAHNLISELRKIGHKVTVVAWSSLGDYQREEQDGVSVYRIPEFVSESTSRIGILVHWLRLFRLFFHLRREFDVLHTHGVTLESSFTAVIGRLLGKPVIVKSTLSGELSVKNNLGIRIRGIFLRNVDVFVALSKDIVKEYERQSAMMNSSLVLVPNGVDTIRFRPVNQRKKNELRESLGLPHGPILIYHGVFMERKSIDWLITSLEDFFIEKRLTLVLLGDPCRDEADTGYYKKLLCQVERFIADGSIIIRGFSNDVHRYLQASDGYVLPSTGEGLSNALLEAMSVGLIPIVSRASGSKDLVKDRYNGMTFKSRDTAELHEAVSWYLSIAGTSKEQLIKEAARKTIDDGYSIAEIASRYSTMYIQMTGGKKEIGPAETAN